MVGSRALICARMGCRRLMARSLLVPKTFAMTELSKTVSFGADFVPNISVNGMEVVGTGYRAGKKSV